MNSSIHRKDASGDWTQSLHRVSVQRTAATAATEALLNPRMSETLFLEPGLAHGSESAQRIREILSPFTAGLIPVGSNALALIKESVSTVLVQRRVSKRERAREENFLWVKYLHRLDDSSLLESSFKNIEGAIVSASEESNPERSVEQLDKILEALTCMEDLGEVKLRLAIRRTTPLKAAETPDWLSSQLDELRLLASEGQLEYEVSNELISIGERLVCLALQEFGAEADNVRVRILPFAPRALEISWVGGLRSLRWVVRESSVPWPGINVRAYISGRKRPHELRTPIVKSSRFRTVKRLVRHARQTLFVAEEV